MTTINAKFITKDNHQNDGAVVYWFDVDGETYGVVEGGKESSSNVVDVDSCPSDHFTADQFEITDEMRAN